MTDAVSDAVERIRSWGEAHDWKGYDPYDGLNSPLARVLSAGPPMGRRVLTQAVKLSPVNLRPALGIRPDWNAKAIGLVAAGYARLASAGDAQAATQAERWLGWLAANPARGTAAAWGYHFEVQTRVFRYARDTPNTIATSFVAQALFDAQELLGDEGAGRLALDAAEFLLERMLGEGDHGLYFRYLPDEGDLVHNANLLACAVVARASRVSGDDALLDCIREPVATSLAAQREDGSWPYAGGGGHDWVDNFHTAYVLGAVAECARSMEGLEEPLDRGVSFWERELFLADGTPKYYANKVRPLDAHCYATAIDTWLTLADLRSDALARAHRIALLLIDRMLDPRGFVHFQQRRFWTSRVPLVRWTTAPSFCALAGVSAAQA